MLRLPDRATLGCPKGERDGERARNRRGGEYRQPASPPSEPHYPDLRLTDVTRPAELGSDEHFVPAELSRIEEVEAAVEGVEGIVHLGGIATEAPWERILQCNIIGCYNLFEAARRKGVRRIVFASSNHTIGFYRRYRRLTTDQIVRPDSRYGVSKAFGEALGALYADKYGIGVTCLRIGNLDDRAVDLRRLSIWLAPGDLVHLIRIGLEHPEIRFEVLWGVSDNERGWWDNSRAYALGYRPEGRAEDFRDEALAAERALPPDPIGDLFQGGGFCSAEFQGSPEQVQD